MRFTIAVLLGLLLTPGVFAAGEPSAQIVGDGTIKSMGQTVIKPAPDRVVTASHTVNAVNVQVVTPDGKIDRSRMVTVPPRVEITDSTGTHVYMLQKPPLKQRIQQSAKRAAKKVRLGCHFMAPIVSFVGSVSQTVMAFKTH